VEFANLRAECQRQWLGTSPLRRKELLSGTAVPPASLRRMPFSFLLCNADVSLFNHADHP
jgi:hypothetical protein